MTGEAGFGNRTSTSEELVFNNKAEDRSEKAMAWLLHYVAQDWSPLTLHTTLPVLSTAPMTTTSKAGQRPKTATKEADTDRWTCLLCNSRSYSKHHPLTRHNKGHHINQGTFNQPFPCPQCSRDNVPPPTISSATEWADHVETTHGKLYAPVVTEKHLSTPVHPRKRKRDEDEMNTELSIAGEYILDLSEEKRPQKKARKGEHGEGRSCRATGARTSSASSDCGETCDFFFSGPFLKHYFVLRFANFVQLWL